MSISLALKAWVRQLGILNYAEGENGSLNVNARGDLLMAQASAYRAEGTRLGLRWGKLTDAVATIATAVPTTTAAHTLWNGEPAGGKSYVLESVTWLSITSAAAASGFGLVGCLNVLPLTAQPATADTLTKVTSMNGRVYPGRAKSSKTVTVVDDGWWPLPVQNAFTLGTGTVSGSLILHAPLDGGVIVPPGCVFGASALSVGTTATGNLFFCWREEQIYNQLS